jgi:hypothetical protein
VSNPHKNNTVVMVNRFQLKIPERLSCWKLSLNTNHQCFPLTKLVVLQETVVAMPEFLKNASGRY